METESVVRKIEEQKWLKPAEDWLKGALDKTFEPDRRNGRPVENALHGVWLGHALHPALTDLPVGAWSVAFILDAIEETTGKRRYQAGADAAVTIGLIGAAGAALTGITDWKEISTEARRTGLVHGLLNAAATGLYLISAMQRARGKRGSARSLAYVAYGLTVGSAWLGGHLVYANQIAVERRPGAPPPTEFVPVMPIVDLVDRIPRRGDLKDFPIVLVKKGERIYALSESCSHLGGPLSQGTVEGDCIRCPWHGSVFSLDTGAVIESPATRPQVAFEARVRNGQVEVRARRDAGSDIGTAPSTTAD